MSSDVHEVKILLIEDNPAHAELVLHALANMPSLRAEVRWELLLSKGLQALGSDDGFDLVLLDLNLPGSSLEHTLPMARLAAQRGVGLVAITSLADRVTVEHCLASGARACLDKSAITPELLEAALDTPRAMRA